MPRPAYCPYCPGATFTPEHAATCQHLADERIVTLALDTGAVLGEREGEVREIRPEKVTP